MASNWVTTDLQMGYIEVITNDPSFQRNGTSARRNHPSNCGCPVFKLPVAKTGIIFQSLPGAPRVDFEIVKVMVFQKAVVLGGSSHLVNG